MTTTIAGYPMRKFAFYLAPKFSMMSLLSMTEPLRAANEIAGRDIYEYAFFGDAAGTTAINGMTIATETVMARKKNFDAVIACASYEAEKGVTRKAVDWLRWLGAHGIVLGSADTGAYLLAATGIWGKTPFAMHWLSRPAFEARYPEFPLSHNTIELAAKRISCAGATTGIDMMLHIMKADLGEAFSGKVANHFIHNNGKERASIEHNALSELLRGIRVPEVRRALQLMESRVDARITVVEIAQAVGLTMKQLERQFRREVNETPTSVYQHIRLSRAYNLLQQSDLPVDVIATTCGFLSRTQFSAAFRAKFGTSPSSIRAS